MQTSESIVELLTALCAARLEFGVITRNRQGFSKRGGQKYGYADLNAIIDATESALAQHGLNVMQFLEDGPDRTQTTVKSMLFHLSGQWISSQLTVDHPNDPQEFGIVTTYAKRYMQQAMLNLSTEGDDQDGTLSEDAAPTRRPRESRQPSPAPAVQSVTNHGEAQKVPSTGMTESARFFQQSTLPKPTADEVSQLLELMRGVYKDEAVVDHKVRTVLKIPIGQKMEFLRIKNTMTRTHHTTLQEQATADAMQSAPPDDDVSDFSGPEDATLPSNDTQASGEGDGGSDTPEASSEASSMSGEAITSDVMSAHAETPETSAPSEEFRPIDVDADGYAVEREMAKLKQLAITQGKQSIHRDMLRETPQMKVGRFRYCWVELARAKVAEVKA